MTDKVYELEELRPCDRKKWYRIALCESKEDLDYYLQSCDPGYKYRVKEYHLAVTNPVEVKIVEEMVPRRRKQVVIDKTTKL